MSIPAEIVLTIAGLLLIISVLVSKVVDRFLCRAASSPIGQITRSGNLLAKSSILATKPFSMGLDQV